MSKRGTYSADAAPYHRRADDIEAARWIQNACRRYIAGKDPKASVNEAIAEWQRATGTPQPSEPAPSTRATCPACLTGNHAACHALLPQGQSSPCACEPCGKQWEREALGPIADRLTPEERDAFIRAENAYGAMRAITDGDVAALLAIVRRLAPVPANQGGRESSGEGGR